MSSMKQASFTFLISPMVSILSVLRDYLSHSSFHGVHYLVDPGLHWSERLFWLGCVLACWFGSVMLSISWMEFAYEHPVTLSVDTSYLDWKTPGPGIVVCEVNSPKLLSIKDLVLREKMQQRIFFDYYLSQRFNHNMSNEMWTFRNFLSNCSEIFNYCSWKNIEFDCCKGFSILSTALGPCYAINTIQSYNMSWDSVSHVQRELGDLILEFKNPCIKIYAISNDEIVTEKNKPLILQNTIGAYTEYKIFLTMALTTSQPEIKQIEIERRKCRFPNENYLTISRNYSYDACKLQCQKQAHFKLFNCTHHYMPFTEKKDICSEDQLYNLIQSSEDWRKAAEENCHCDLGCIYNDVLFLGKSFVTERTVKLHKKDTMTYVHINIAASSVKTIRKMAYNMLDNIVNMGGIAGLLVGASLLSIFEIFYFFTIRAFDTSLMERSQQRRKLKLKPKPRPVERERIIVIQPHPIYIQVYPFVN